MNLLIFEQKELNGGTLTLTDRRAEHLLNVLKVNTGDFVRLGMVNGAVGRGQVIVAADGEVSLEVELDKKPVHTPHVELILALPRPIMLQRILKQGTVLGIRRFHLIRSRRVEKSFFHSPVLAPRKIKELLVEGMEQGMDTHLPDVTIHSRFKPFAEDYLPGLGGTGIIAHPGAGEGLGELNLFRAGGSDPLILAVGPEGGWNDFELDMFAEKGFRPFTMGRRILHVDTAVVALLSQLQLLYDLANR